MFAVGKKIPRINWRRVPVSAHFGVSGTASGLV
jgi:hypothetical protein